MPAFVPKRRGRGEGLFDMSRRLLFGIYALCFTVAGVVFGKLLASAVMAWVHS